MNKNFPELMKYTKPKTQKYKYKARCIEINSHSVFVTSQWFCWRLCCAPSPSLHSAGTDLFSRPARLLLVDLSRNSSPKEPSHHDHAPFQGQSDVEDVKAIASGPRQRCPDLRVSHGIIWIFCTYITAQFILL